jgi:hypothetical protein
MDAARRMLQAPMQQAAPKLASGLFDDITNDVQTSGDDVRMFGESAVSACARVRGASRASSHLPA